MADVVKRDSFKSSILKLIKYINTIDIKNAPPLTDLTVRQKCLNDRWESFVNMHLEILERTGSQEIATQSIEFDTVESFYINASAKLAGYIDQIQKLSNIPIVNSPNNKLQAISQLIDNIETYAEINGPTADEGALQANTKELDRLYSQYEQLSLDSVGEEQLSETFAAVHNKYRMISSMLLTNLARVRNLNQQQQHQQGNRHRVNDITAKLPKLEPPSFDGSILGWESFRDLFTSIIHQRTDISNVLKLQYLQSCMKGDASSIIRNFALTNENYDSAWQLLLDRFDDRKSLVMEHLRHILALPQCKGSAVDLKALLNKTTESLRALTNMNRPVDQWDDWVVVLTVDRLDGESRKLWEQAQSISNEFPTWKDMEIFLQGRIRAIGATNSLSLSAASTSRSSNTTRSHQAATTAASKCIVCSKAHRVSFCDKFKRKSVTGKRNFVKDHNLCFNCLSENHSVSDCTSKFSCFKCKQRHHSSLHLDLSETLSSTNDVNKSPTSTITQPPMDSTALSTTATQPPMDLTSPSTTCASSTSISKNSQVLLATSLVRVIHPSGTSFTLRALLDQGSQSSFITESAVQLLGLNKRKANVTVTGIGSTQTGVAKGCVSFQCVSNYDISQEVDVDALVIPKVTSMPPIAKAFDDTWSHIKGLQLADPLYCQQDKIDLLLGADVYSRILLNDIRRGPPGTPTAQHTIFGWILSGQLYDSETRQARYEPTFNSYCNLSVDDQLQKFWEIEQGPDQRRTLTKEERICEEMFANTYRRNPDGRFVVRLPLINNLLIGSTERIAVTRQLLMEKRFKNNPEFHHNYSAFMTQYNDLHHMEEINCNNNQPSSSNVYYIPHHAVLKESSSTTKLRVVFDASRKSHLGRSLNDQLYIGPRLQQDLTSIVMRWRKHAVVFTADIEKMYRQIQVDKRDCDLQRIVWRQSANDPMQHYRLTTVTYGTSAAPYLAIKTLRQLATDEQQHHPIGASVALRDFYVDDVLTGCDDVPGALEVQRQLNNLLASGQFVLKKWASNREELLQDLPSSYLECHLPLHLNLDETIKTLGIFWNPAGDCFGFKTKVPEATPTPTKRQFLSDIARLYDPLGWLAPTIVVAKLMLQELWRRRLDWDDTLTADLTNMWSAFREDLHLIEAIKIPRWIGTKCTSKDVQIHGFCDASMGAYAAVVYVRNVSLDNKINVSLVTAKSKVAPIKTLSIPRLELCGAVLLTQLLETVLKSMEFENATVHAWTDSTIVLAWLAGDPSRWNVFVANRVTTILSTLAREKWHHVVSQENPADCASRGVPPAQLKDLNLWWNGPHWLNHSIESWPTQDETHETLEDIRTASHQADIKSALQPCWDLISDFSSLSNLVRVTAYLIRFGHNSRRHDIHDRQFGPLQPNELTIALNVWISATQAMHYYDEIKLLRSDSPISTKSSIVRLTPFLDDCGLLRVGGRLQRSPLSYQERHPIILPRKSPLTQLLIAHSHLQCLHGGVQATLGHVGRQYWIIDSRNQVRQHIHRCIKCFRQKPLTQTQIMANLPASRITPARPFLHSAVDYSGFIRVRSAKGRGHHSTKAYVALFVCLVTKAIHLEAVSDLTSAAFIAAYRRFVSRRGICSDIYSDNGTNFVGANTDLKNQKKASSRGQTIDIQERLANDGTTWHFSPPLSPHFNGLAEAGIRSSKHHIKRIIGEATLTFEELGTLLSQIEACLNSRPLYPLTADPNEPSPLTPAHFLIGSALTSVPDRSLLDINCNRLTRWQLVQRMLQQFWKRWSTEYIHHMYQRSKWDTLQPDLQIGNMVLIKEDNLPPSKWAIGRIIGTRPGKDGHVRVVRVRYGNSESDRPIVKLAVLPLPENLQ